MVITPDTHVADLATTSPATIKVFQQYGIDFCCGGHRPLADACAEASVDISVLLDSLQGALNQPRELAGWSDAPLTALIHHIRARFHEPLRTELVRLTAMLDKVLSRHGDRHPEMLPALAHTFRTFNADLLSHMVKEEQILFPAIEALERGDRGLPLPCGTLAGPIGVMELEHADAGAALAEMRRLTNNYTPPEGACPTFQGLFWGLAELERDMHLHVHLENNILFPRAAAAAGLELR
jgi:regulator of cell morphogenesis and NO signaling